MIGRNEFPDAPPLEKHQRTTMKTEVSFSLIDGEFVILQIDDTWTHVNAGFGKYSRSARIIFTDRRIICEIRSILGGTKAVVSLKYLELASIVSDSESHLSGLTLIDRKGDSIKFNCFENDLRGCQIYLLFFYCCVDAYHENPHQVLESMRSLRLGFRIPSGLFRSDMKYSNDFQDLLKYWGVKLPENARPYVDSNALVYRTVGDRKKDETAASNNRPSIAKTENHEPSKRDLYRIVGIYAKDGEVVRANQTILRVISGGMREKNLYSDKAGRIMFISLDSNSCYSEDELRGLYMVNPVDDEKKVASIHSEHSSNSLEHCISPRAERLLKELDALVGLIEVKEKVKEVVAIARVNQRRKELNTPIVKVSNHMIFSGNPGTGKTTIARKLGEVFKEIGLLSKGHFIEVQRSNLVGGYLGQTAIKTEEVIQRALGGILFIDEAYSLAPELSSDSFGKEAVNTLVAGMENHREDLIVIAAGYRDEMTSFLGSNPGLRSRFATIINFADYSNSELTEIFIHLITESGMNLGGGCQKIVSEMIELVGSKRSKGFGNAREIRILFEKIMAAQNTRLSSIVADEDQLRTILPEDIRSVMKKTFPAVVSPTTDSREELKSLVGLSSVKQEIERLIRLCNLNAMRKKRNLGIISTSLHMVFTGNPGTGKTTVARIVAKSLYETGFLSKNCLLEVSREDLVAGFVGQTALKTKSKLETALGGVLFIDEAYSLCEDSNQHNYGKEAVDTILKFMEDNRDNIVVILAGYSGGIAKLLSSNPGLKGRFNRFIRFEDYDPGELVMVFDRIATSSDYRLSLEFRQRLGQLIKMYYSCRTSEFANGRAMRNLFEKVIERQAERLCNSASQANIELLELSLDDLVEVDVREVMKS